MTEDHHESPFDSFSGPLHEKPVECVKVGDSELEIFAASVSPPDAFALWRQARGELDKTHHWPLLLSGWGVALDKFGFRLEGDPRQVIDDAAAIDPDEAAEAMIAEELERKAPENVDFLLRPYAEALEWELEQTQARAGAAPTADVVRAALGSDARGADLDRWLLEWEESERPGAVEVDSRYLGWFEPDEFDQCYLAMLPTTKGSETLAYVPFYAEDSIVGATPERLVAIVSDWNDRYGAELVAHWGTMLQFVVDRPPEALADSWQLARRQVLIAGSTLAGPGVLLRDHARALVGRKKWFLHDRP